MARKIIKLKKLNDEKKKNKQKTNKDNSFFSLKIHISDILLAIAVLFLTFMLTTQINIVSKSEDILQNRREAQLADDLIKLKDQYDDLKDAYDKNKQVVDEYSTNSATNDKLIASMRQELIISNALAGLKAVKGEGITLAIEDSTRQPTEEVPIESLVIYSTDLAAVLNELKEAGAEAISINGNRIIANSSIRSVGPSILVNDQKITSPYIIKAIGNAQYLESAINLKGGVADSLKKYGIRFNITREKQVVIEKFDGTLSFKYADIAE